MFRTEKLSNRKEFPFVVGYPKAYEGTSRGEVFS